MNDRIFTKAEAAAHLRCSTRQIDRLRATGRLKAMKLGPRGIRFFKADVEALLGA